jgi:hypothetical protein
MRAALPFFFERLEITRADAATHGRSFDDRELSTIEKKLLYCRVVVIRLSYTLIKAHLALLPVQDHHGSTTAIFHTLSSSLPDGRDSKP